MPKEIRIEKLPGIAWGRPVETHHVLITAARNTDAAPIALDPIEAVEFANEILDAAEAASEQNSLLQQLGTSFGTATTYKT